MKTHVFMLAFNGLEVIEGGLQNFKETVDDNDSIRKVLFSVDYPLPDPHTHLLATQALANRYGWLHAQMPNKGVAGNWTQAFLFLNPGMDDVVIGFDPDCRMRPKGWLPAITAANMANPEAPCIIPNRSFHDEEWCYKEHGREIYTDANTGLRMGKYQKLVAWSMGTHRADWLWFLIEKEGEFKAYNQVYGWSEHWQRDMQVKYGKDWLELVDFYDDHVGASHPQYIQWKLESAQGKTKEKFEDWIKSS